MRRLTILLAALGALLLVPAAQAFANGNAIISIEGTGKGKLVAGEFIQGNPAVNCSYESPGPATGTCNTELSAEFGVEGVGVEEIPAAGSEFAGWEFEGGTEGIFCTGKNTSCYRYQEEGAGSDIHITAYFNLKPAEFPLTIKTTGSGTVSEFKCRDITNEENQSKKCASGYLEGHEIEIDPQISIPNQFKGWTGCDKTKENRCTVTMTGARTVSVKVTAPSKGPTNRATLTVKKSGPANSAGTVKSKPKGVNCASACSEATASYYKNTTVSLEAKPATGSSFTEWTGACTGSSPTCSVSMTAAKEVTAVFAPVGLGSKEILNPVTLTLIKPDLGFETGHGTVKATGLACEADCTGTVVNYSSGGGPKAKPATIVTLTATTAPGSTFTGWSGSGCSGTGTCVVTMSSAKSVEATFTALPKNTLTVKKSGPANSAGTVKSKPKAINCASACSEAVASLSSDTTVSLEAKPATGSSFTEWTGACTGSSPTCSVSMTAAKEVTAVFAPVGLGSKEILNPVTLTLSKGESTGYGTVKATGLACEVLCTSTKVSYSSGGGPKAKPAAIVTLEATTVPGSEFTGWSGAGCSGTGTCVVTMSEAKSVTATFNELP